MTNELAIRILTGDVLATAKQTQDAVITVVKALSQPDVPDINVGDTISRQAAIDLVEDIETRRLKGEVGLIYAPLIKGLRALPSAQPERNRGEWIDYTEDGYVECPFCHSATNCDGNKDELHFCFSCGADMRGGENDGCSQVFKREESDV